MVATRWLAFSALVLLPVLGGCLSPAPRPLAPVIHPDNLQAPEATIRILEDNAGAVLEWRGPVAVPGGLRFTIPPEVTRVDAVYHRRAAANDALAPLAFYNAETSRIRCQPDFTAAWFAPFTDELRCSGLTQVDPLDGEFLVQWRTAATFNRRGSDPTGSAYLHDGERIEVLLSTAPLDGQAAQIKLDQLAMPRFEALATEPVTIAASDGVLLYAELTRPKTDEKVPTIISSNPYNQATRAAGVRAENATINNWVPRGYAVLSADVRGFAKSGGCIEVWGPKEQRDQYDLVEWAARQPWSNGKVGFYGQSYVGTTPVEAASLQAPHLTTIITIAPVINAYEDWHFGGVPNGENLGSPFSYQASDTLFWVNTPPLPSNLGNYPGAFSGYLTNAPARLARAADQAENGFCDPSLAARANDPRAVYDDFYRERDFKAKADKIRASVFYTQGFYDVNVKSQMIPGWFDKLNVPKKALFGDWVHQHPPRADQELLFHAWFDHWLLGRDTGIMDTPPVEVRTNVDTVRTAMDWPPKDAVAASYGIRIGSSKLARDERGEGARDVMLHGATNQPPLAGASDRVVGTSEVLTERLYIAGEPRVDLRATLHTSGNAYFFAQLIDVAPNGRESLVTYGMLNAALRNGYERFEPVPAGTTIEAKVPMLVTEYVVEPGHRLRFVLRGADVEDATGGLPWTATNLAAGGGRATIDGAGTALVLPVLLEPGDSPAPDSAGPHPRSTKQAS